MADNVVSFPHADSADGDGLGSPAGTQGNLAVRVELEDPQSGDLAIEVLDDGTVAVTAPAVISHRDEDDGFDDNLAERAGQSVMFSLADEIIQGVDADIASRSDLIEQYNAGLDLLGTKLEEIGSARSEKRGISKVGNPLLLESIVKYHAGALGEMLPAAGPAKVATTGRVSSDEDQIAQDFADDLNYFLTEIATEHYPDTSRMLVHQGYSGNAYKKIYRCGLRDRPVSESVSMIDLIVSEEATDLDTATRVTHQFFPTRSQVRRMQILGRYRDDLRLGQPSAGLPPANRAVKYAEGLAAQAMRPQDQPYNFLEVDLDIDFDFYPIAGKYERRAPDGLPLPYKVTIDRDSRQVFGLWRNWEDGDRLYRKDNMYVRYGLVPSMGFHHWGFLHLLGNQTRALRAVWRILIDSGMFANFPGGVKLRGTRTSTNEISPGPGEFVDIDAAGVTDIRQILMALPYKSADAVFIQFAQMVQESAERLGGAVSIETGEGRTNIPVGTIMSQIEQNTQIMAAVHKSNHLAQKHELMKLRKLFAKNPQDLWAANPDPRRRWQVAREFMDLNLMPASDPNIPSQVSRIMQAWALLTLVQQAPGQFDVVECLRRALQAIRIAEPQTLLISPNQTPGGTPPAPPDPALMAATLKAQAQQQQAQAKLGELQLKGQQQDQEHQARMAEGQQDAATADRDRQLKAQGAALESADRAADRQSHLQIEQMKMQQEAVKQGQQQAHEALQQGQQQTHDAQQNDLDRQNQPHAGFDAAI